MPAAIITPAISASSASIRRAPSSIRFRSAVAPRTMLRSVLSSAPASGLKPCRMPSTPSFPPTSPTAATAKTSWPPGAGSARRPSRRPSMALLDLANGLLLDSGGEPAVVLEPTADAAALSAAAGNGAVVAIRFPSFGDGRGHSLAVLLRERHGFKGELRAVGYLIPDLAPFLLRSGFDTAEITDRNDAGIWKAALTRITSSYQPGFRNPLPLRRDASREEASELDAKLAQIKSLPDR